MWLSPEITADNRNIVIRAIGPGTATVTVTATNSGGSVSQSFKVTVPQQHDTVPHVAVRHRRRRRPPDLTIELMAKARLHASLAPGQILQEPAGEVVDVWRKSREGLIRVTYGP